MLTGSYIFPHPPIIISEIGKGEEAAASKTISGVNELAQDISHKNPDTIIVITPHGPLFRDALCINTDNPMHGDFSQFGAGRLKYTFENDLELAEEIANHSEKSGIAIIKNDKSVSRMYNITTELDHGALVPLHFVKKYSNNYRLVHITYGMLSFEDLFKFGQIIDEIAKKSDKNIVVIASGDLSHRLTPDAPAGYNPRGKEFDELIIHKISENKLEEILDFDRTLCECAGECGHRSFIILSGILDGYNVYPKVISYEGPFGVGYATAKFEFQGERKTDTYERLISKKQQKIQKIRDKEDEYVRLARASLEYYILNGHAMQVPQDVSQELLNTKAGAFVTINKDGELRGCIGTISPTQSSLAKEIIQNAISSGTRDPRFDPVEDYELGDLVYSVDVLSEPEPISSTDMLDPRRYGVIVSKGNRSGLLLPNLEGIDTINQQVSIALQKGGIHEHEDYSLERFEVIRHGTK